MVDTVLVCPECGKPLAKHNLVGHALTHFPDYLDPAKSSPLARERQKAILAGGVPQAKYDKEHEEA